MSTALAKQKEAFAGYTAEQIEMIKSNIADKSYTDDELAYCLAVAKARNLDPFRRQIYFSKRRTKSGDEWVSKLTAEPTIDGLRSMAEETNQIDGQDGPYWCGEDGQWRDVWTSNKPPVAAKVVIFRKGSARGFVGVARFDSYVQLTKEGKITHMWQKMPDNQLAKCAEALALRKAFPQQLSGIYTKEEMDQSDNAPDRFANMPAPKAVAVLPAPKPTSTLQGPPPDTIEVLPDDAVLAFGLQQFQGRKLNSLETADLEEIQETVIAKLQKAKTENGRAWLNKIGSTCVALLNERGQQ